MLPQAPRSPNTSNGVRLGALLLASVFLAAAGCTSVEEYFHNGFKVGPNYKKPAAPVANEWIDSKAKGVNVAAADLRGWWRSFNDPKLDDLIEQAYRQNLTLRAAGLRVQAARAQRNIALGNLLPQQQQATYDYSRNALSGNLANLPPAISRFFDLNGVGVNLAWEVDFWGRFRRGVEAANAELDATVENYDDALVILISEVASTYVQIRIYQQRLKYIDDNVAIQTQFVKQAEDRLKGGVGRKIDQGQMRSNLQDTLALREQTEIGLRQANNALSVLLGMPVVDLVANLGVGDIPVMPPEAAVGMPADLLRRRPDLRRLERLVAAQSARIGIAESNLYPHIQLIGSIGYEAANFNDMFSPKSLSGSIGPSVRWDVLNYGRLVNGIRVQDALFQAAAVDYQNAVLKAGREVEDSLVVYLRSQTRTRQLTESAKEAKVAVEEALVLSKDVKFDLNTAFVTSNFLVGQQDKLAQSRGDIALGFIQIYRALGGGWEIRLENPATFREPEAIGPPQKEVPQLPPMPEKKNGVAPPPPPKELPPMPPLPPAPEKKAAGVPAAPQDIAFPVGQKVDAPATRFLEPREVTIPAVELIPAPRKLPR